MSCIIFEIVSEYLPDVGEIAVIVGVLPCSHSKPQLPSHRDGMLLTFTVTWGIVCSVRSISPDMGSMKTPPSCVVHVATVAFPPTRLVEECYIENSNVKIKLCPMKIRLYFHGYLYDFFNV